ncbi:MAG: alpha/beta fold hydrolase [Pseudomonadota bacterium]
MSKFSLPLPGHSNGHKLTAAHGAIQLAISMPAGKVRGVAVVCHPHPLFGGAMTNKVVTTLASTAQHHGFATVRFNFRGVGQSEGSHDQGRGETDDAVVVAQWLQTQQPGLPLLLAGFSFGAFIALKAAARLKPALLATVAPPFKYFESEPRPAHPGCPWIVLHSMDDDVVSYESTKTELMRYQPAPELVTLQGAGHFFHSRLNDVQQPVSDWLAHNGFAE